MAYISTADWLRYINRLAAINRKARDEMVAWIGKHGFSDTAALVDFAFGLATKYGEGAGALAAEMYDATAKMQNALYEPAVPAPTATYQEVQKAVRGTAKSRNPDQVGNAVGRLVKRTAADTTLRNAARDGAEFAWVPHGDTCAFCIMLASNGWLPMSEKALKGGHAQHIHANCDCEYAVRFDGRSGIKGYDPDKYLAMYNNAEGHSWQEKVNSMRRAQYAENADRINEQKRAAYKKRKLNQKNNDGINSRTPGHGRPVNVALWGAPLTRKQEKILERLTEYNSRGIFKKRDVSMQDLAAMTAQTGDEFAMFTRQGERLVIRGSPVDVPIMPEDADALASEGYRWSGHTHPGTYLTDILPSPGDRGVISAMKQRLSSIYSPTGRCYVFGEEEEKDYGFKNL